MKTVTQALLTTALTLTGWAAQAADPRMSRLPDIPALPAYYSWSGVYVGLQAGYAWTDNRLRDALTTGPVLLATAHGAHADAAIGGGHLGANYQFGALVIGIEGDVEATNAHRRFTDAFGDGRVKQDWQASVRGRAGYAFDRFMIYGTAGVAFAAFDYARSAPAAGFAGGTNASRTGWTAGGGAQYALTDSVIFGLDYRYSDFGRFEHVSLAGGATLSGAQDVTQHALRASVGYKF